MSFLKIFFTFILYAISFHSFSESIINIQEITTLENSKKYDAALKILSPCLTAKPSIISNLEKCLYYGEHISSQKLTFHNHKYIKRLISLFPDSKYRDIYDYVIIERGYNSTELVMKWIDSLKTYRAKYPEGYHFFKATIDLANAYDDLWEILMPNPGFGGFLPSHHNFSSGDKEKDKKNAEINRNKALKLYTYLMKYGIPKTKYEKHLLQESMERIKTLTNRKLSNSFYILND